MEFWYFIFEYILLLGTKLSVENVIRSSCWWLLPQLLRWGFLVFLAKESIHLRKLMNIVWRWGQLLYEGKPFLFIICHASSLVGKTAPAFLSLPIPSHLLPCAVPDDVVYFLSYVWGIILSFPAILQGHLCLWLIASCIKNTPSFFFASRDAQSATRHGRIWLEGTQVNENVIWRPRRDLLSNNNERTPAWLVHT